MEQSIQLVNAIALARGVSEPSNRDVFWLDESLTGEWYERLKAYNLDSGEWQLVQRTPAQLLKDLKTVDGAGSGLDADTLRGFTPQQLMGSGGGGGSVPELNTGQLLVGQGSGVGEAKTVSGIATIGVDGSLTFNPGSISHTDLANIGTNTHAQIDNHIANTSNPHSVTATQVGKDTAQWNADRLNGNTVNTGTPTGVEDGFAVTWDNAAGEFVLASAGGDSIYTADGATGVGTRQVTVTDILEFVNGQVKINALELTAIDRGFLLNRVTTGEMNLITSPTTGEVVYNTDLNALQEYNGGSWQFLNGSNLSSSVLTWTGDRTHDLAGFENRMDNGKFSIQAENSISNDDTEWVFKVLNSAGTLDFLRINNDGFFLLGIGNIISAGSFFDYSTSAMLGYNNSISSGGGADVFVFGGLNSVSGSLSRFNYILASASSCVSSEDNRLFGREIDSTHDEVTLIGSNIVSGANGGSVIGYGVSTVSKLSNTVADSIGFGWNTTTPYHLLSSTGAILGGQVNMAGLPTSSAGLSAGDLWNNSGVINIV